MLNAKNKKTATLLGAIFGLVVILFAFLRANKQAKASGGKVTLTDAAKVEVKALFMSCMGWLAFLGLAVIGFTSDVNGASMAQVIGTVVSGVGLATNLPTLTYVPQFIYFEISTVPQSIKVNVNGDGLVCDLDGAGITAMSNIRSNGRPTNGYLIQISNGLIKNKNVDITITNGVASAFTAFAINGNEVVDVPAYLISTGITINAAQSFNLEQFSYVALPSFVAADILNLYGYKRKISGEQVNSLFSTKQEFETLRGLLQLTENMTVGKNAIDNYDGTWSELNFTPNASQRVYVQRAIEVGKFTPVLLG